MDKPAARPITDICFVMAPLGPPGSPTRHHSDAVLERLIEPAVAQIGHTVLRADQIHKAGHINSQVLDHIASAALAVADLTGLNPNVMYELAVRHGTGRAACQIASEGTALPFDIAGLRTVFFDLDDSGSMKSAESALSAQLEHACREPGQRLVPAFGEPSAAVGLTDEQTRNLIRLHQASSAYRMYRVIDEVVSELDEDSKEFDVEDFFRRIRNALMESRRLCAPFESQRLGKFTEFYDNTYPPDELRQAVDGGLRILLNPSLSANAKRKQLLAYVRHQQMELDSRIEKALTD